MQINRERPHWGIEVPTLQNPRHEKFAQELAAGHSAAEAYTRAGYEPNYGNCIRLKGNERVAARVAEIQYGGAVRADVSIASVLGKLEEVRTFAKERNEAATMTTRQHNPPVYRFDIDRGDSDASPPRTRSSPQELAPGYLWNSTTQELIPILPEDHPAYRENAETIRAAFLRWERGTSK